MKHAPEGTEMRLRSLRQARELLRAAAERLATGLAMGMRVVGFTVIRIGTD